MEHPSAGRHPAGSALPHKLREQNVLHHSGRGQSPRELFIPSGGEAAACLATRDRAGEEGDGTGREMGQGGRRDREGEQHWTWKREERLCMFMHEGGGYRTIACES